MVAFGDKKTSGAIIHRKIAVGGQLVVAWMDKGAAGADM